MNDLESLLDDVKSLELLTSISSVEQKSSNKSLNDWHGCFLEMLDLVSSCSMWNVNLTLGLLNSNVVLKSNVDILDLVVVPFSKELWGFAKLVEFFDNGHGL